MSEPVYAVRVTLKGRPALVPMKALALRPTGSGSSVMVWGVGYVMPSGHHKHYNCRGNEDTYFLKEQAVDRLEKLATVKGWQKWPEDRPTECIYLDEEETTK